MYVPTPQGLVPIPTAALALLMPASGHLGPAYALPEGLQARHLLGTPLPSQQGPAMPWTHPSAPRPTLAARAAALPSPPKRPHGLTPPGSSPLEGPAGAQDPQAAACEPAAESPACKRPRPMLAGPDRAVGSLAALADAAEAANGPAKPASGLSVQDACLPDLRQPSSSRPDKAASWSPGGSQTLHAPRPHRATAFSAWKPAGAPQAQPQGSRQEAAGSRAQEPASRGDQVPKIHRPKPIKATAAQPALYLLSQQSRSSALAGHGLGAFSRRPLEHHH